MFDDDKTTLEPCASDSFSPALNFSGSSAGFTDGVPVCSVGKGSAALVGKFIEQQ